jgi:hypothetical protein
MSTATMSTTRPPYRAGDRVFAIWHQNGQGTVGGTRTVTACTPRDGQAGWKLSVAVSDERRVTYLLTRTGHSDYVTRVAKVATTTPG